MNLMCFKCASRPVFCKSFSNANTLLCSSPAIHISLIAGTSLSASSCVAERSALLAFSAWICTAACAITSGNARHKARSATTMTASCCGWLSTLDALSLAGSVGSQCGKRICGTAVCGNAVCCALLCVAAADFAGGDIGSVASAAGGLSCVALGIAELCFAKAKAICSALCCRKWLANCCTVGHSNSKVGYRRSASFFSKACDISSKASESKPNSKNCTSLSCARHTLLVAWAMIWPIKWCSGSPCSTAACVTGVLGIGTGNAVIDSAAIDSAVTGAAGSVIGAVGAAIGAVGVAIGAAVIAPAWLRLLCPELTKR